LAASAEFLTYLQDQFERFGPVANRRMFGGTGLFRDGVMFGIVVRDTLYLKTDEHSQADFEAAGMGPFRYDRRGRTVSLGYHEVPADVLEDVDALAEWAATAVRVAMASKRKTARRKSAP